MNLSSRAARSAALVLSLAAANTACTADTTSPTDSEDLKGAVTTKALAKGNSEFATDLYGELAAGTDNTFFSPYSISSAIAMTYAGAKGATANAMKGTMHFPSGNVHVGFKGLAGELEKRAHAPSDSKGEAFQLSIANSLWGEKTQHFQSSFTTLVQNDYGAGVMPADFLGKPDAERTRINAWVEDKTNDKIKDLLPSGTLTRETKLVLVNAIYFKAAWDRPFQKTSTEKAPFTTLSGKKVQVDTMWSRRGVKSATTSDYDAIALPYTGGDVEFVAIAPKKEFATFESSLDASKLDDIYAGLEDREVNLSLPKFKIAGASVKLKDTLTKLGMGVAFTDNADFSGITGKSDTKISDVVHKAFIDLDEAGTEAAAATAVIMIGKTAMPHQVPEMHFDRPFIFAIRDVPTGSILFFGRVVNPNG